MATFKLIDYASGSASKVFEAFRDHLALAVPPVERVCVCVKAPTYDSLKAVVGGDAGTQRASFFGWGSLLDLNASIHGSALTIGQARLISPGFELSVSTVPSLPLFDWNEMESPEAYLHVSSKRNASLDVRLPDEDPGLDLGTLKSILEAVTGVANGGFHNTSESWTTDRVTVSHVFQVPRGRVQDSLEALMARHQANEIIGCFRCDGPLDVLHDMCCRLRLDAYPPDVRCLGSFSCPWAISPDWLLAPVPNYDLETAHGAFLRAWELKNKLSFVGLTRRYLGWRNDTGGISRRASLNFCQVSVERGQPAIRIGIDSDAGVDAAPVLRAHKGVAAQQGASLHRVRY